MAYSQSKYRRHLDLQIDDIVKKLHMAAKREVSTELREFSIAAAIFLAHAEVENYFIDILDGFARVLSEGAQNSTRLSSKLRAHLICEKFGLSHVSSKMISKSGEQEIFNVVEKWFVSPHLGLMTGTSALVPMTGVDIYGDYSYPSVKNIERVLKRIGIGDPKGKLNAECRKDVIGILESVGSLRTALAHSAVLPGVSIGDVKARIIALKIFVRAFDRVIYFSAIGSAPNIAWVNSMR